jgi:hypothetical protein
LRYGTLDTLFARGVVLGVMLFSAMMIGGAVAADALKVRVQPGQSLRDIAQQQLGDPDLWTEILRANGLNSVTDVQPGMELTVPAAEIAAADRALRRALAALQQATEQGARLFAAPQIEHGLALYEEGAAKRKAGQWAEAAKAAGQAQLAAGEAMKLAAAGRDAVAEARLSDREGSVEGRKPQDLVWSDRERDAALIEEEKLRTLSRSSAQITFRDDSRLRLNANSQAVIRRMRTDPLSRTEEAKVSLVEGDFYALLSGKSDRKKFELMVPDVDTEVDSRNFWVRRDESGSKFTNYDDGALRVAANGSEVTLGRNEGTLVRNGRQPTDKVGILGAVALEAPADDSRTFSADATLRWAPVPDAKGYWLELAYDQGFQRMTMSRWGLKDTSFATGPLDIGTYYWRIAALDQFGLPGDRGTVWRFDVRVDQTPPYLAIRKPEDGELIRTTPIDIEGDAEKGSRVRLNGAALDIGADGRFATRLDVAPGRNELLLEATDAAGNVTQRRRSFQFVPDEQAVLHFDETIPRLAPLHFVTDRDVISLTGTTDPGSQLLLHAKGAQLRASTYAGDDGRFALNVPLAADTDEFVIDVVQRSGFATKETVTVSQDREPPAIELEAPPPTVTAVEWLPLRGRAAGATGLSINGQPVQLLSEEFDQTVTLSGGRNTIELIAVDLVGNRRVDSFDVQLDQDPPQLVGHNVTPVEAHGGESVRIEVRASDPSGLRKAAPFKLRVGDKDYADFLELGGDSDSYRKTILLPREAAGRIVLREVEVEDYAGNKARFTFDK